MRTSSTKNSLIIGISIVLGASLLSMGISNASGTTIKACAKKSNGAMRLIDVNKKCKKSERTLTWGAQGSAGATGATGSNGSNGYSNSYSYRLAFGETMNLNNYASETSLDSAIWIKEIPAGDYTFNISSQVTYNSESPQLGNAYLKCMLTSKGSYGEAISNRTDVYWPEQYWAEESRPYLLSFMPSVNGEDQISNLSATSTLRLDAPTKMRLVCQMDQGRRDTDPLNDERINLWFISMVFTAVNSDTTLERDPMS
jgi:hypothetical protein